MNNLLEMKKVLPLLTNGFKTLEKGLFIDVIGWKQKKYTRWISIDRGNWDPE